MKNLGNIMKQAQELQSKMTDMQAELQDLEVSGQAGAGMVSVTLSGKGDLKAVVIDPTMFKEDDKEILEDLIVAAHADAKARMEETVAEKMKDVTGNLPLPPGFNLGM